VKRVLILTNGNYISGAEKVTLDVIRGLQKADAVVHCMVSGWNDGQFIAELEKIGQSYTIVKLGWYYLTKIRWSLDSLLHYPAAVLRYLQVCRSFKPDCIYITSYRQLFLLYPFINRKVFYHVHDNNGDSKRSRFFLKLLSHRVHRFIAVSRYIRYDLLTCGVPSDKIVVVYNGIPIPFLTEKSIPYSLGHTFTIGIVGQVIPRKGHMVAVQALSILHKKGLQIKMKIVGRGSEAYIREVKGSITSAGLEQWVDWRGFIDNQAEIYEGIDVVIAPTRDNEAFGLMACEAGAYRKAAIVSRNGGLPEIIIDGVTGYVIDPLSAEEIADRISKFYYDRRMLQMMGEQSRQRISDSFSVLRMQQAINQLIDNS